jgi:hypothetical protein
MVRERSENNMGCQYIKLVGPLPETFNPSEQRMWLTVTDQENEKRIRQCYDDSKKNYGTYPIHFETVHLGKPCFITLCFPFERKEENGKISYYFIFNHVTDHAL